MRRRQPRTEPARAQEAPVSDESRYTEEVKVSGKRLLETLKEIVHQGNVRRIVIKNAEGRTVLDVPLTAGVVGAALLPFWAAVGGIAALTVHYTVVVERAESARIEPPPAG